MSNSLKCKTSNVKTLRRQSSTLGNEVSVRRAVVGDFVDVVKLFDSYSSGVYGFVPHSRIKRHIRDGECFVVYVKGELAAAAIGKPGETLWNIMVKPEYRHMHLGTLLIGVAQPQRIRVKCRPHRGMSSKDLERFTDPTPFYERMGYVFEKWDYPKNFYQGKDETTGKGKMVNVGDMRNVKIMRKLQPGEDPPAPDLSVSPRVTPVTAQSLSRRPRVKC
jgi:GNAT superfamily N-acetyltransferase